jgi:hypothetical protein
METPQGYLLRAVNQCPAAALNAEDSDSGDFMTRLFAWQAAGLIWFGAAAQAAPVTADFAYTVDQDGGQAWDVDLSLSPSERWTLYAGGGQARGSEQTSDLGGTLFNVGASLRGGRAGVSLGYEDFRDQSNYHAGTLAARAWLAAGDFELALLGKRRDLEVLVTVRLPLRTLTRELEFSANGAGLQLSYTREAFSVYVMAMQYDYDRDFDDFIDLVGSPELALRPRIEALVGTIVTQTQGTIDQQVGLGCEFSLGRQSLSVDLSSVHDAVLDAGSHSLAVTWRRAQNAHLDLGVTAGLVDSDTFGGIGFIGAQIGLAN